ncbi:response regulator [Maridesulfovibrio hydrothermalis]|uniref:Response regulator receiver protein n=1 Tax=Maridesulfovibrio hydrothermalis AM13 = DSM 14728 TaxID=1121451 RepID=L0R7I4_9BACT|nr:response regulator [Maridesulfovibrio hydrothermalis]CCO22699.1 Response regulator receiver protein [Maridesulfovibrio hydrothermalis AM13 = DSM 14728]
MQNSILVLDDDIHVRESLVISLEDEEFDVFEAESSEEALNFLEKNHVDLIIVDLRLPGMNGTDFINAANVKWEKVKFIIYTGSPEFSIPFDLARIHNVSKSVFLKPLSSCDVMIDEIRSMLG